jgi:hypothetical protein
MNRTLVTPARYSLLHFHSDTQTVSKLCDYNPRRATVRLHLAPIALGSSVHGPTEPSPASSDSTSRSLLHPSTVYLPLILGTFQPCPLVDLTKVFLQLPIEACESTFFEHEGIMLGLLDGFGVTVRVVAHYRRGPDIPARVLFEKRAIAVWCALGMYLDLGVLRVQ